MNFIEKLTETLWNSFESAEHCSADREMDFIDTGGRYESFDMTQIARAVAAEIQRGRIVETVEQLRAIIPPGADVLGGSLIKTYGWPACGEVYEQNYDGTWGILVTPGPGVRMMHHHERALKPEDVSLPAILIWKAPADPLWQPLEHG